ncbi:hypothetical protein ACFRSX_08115 [Streptomyces goshikiensis]|uniref:hypothetical protein n=1 Tax=Streptomyces TaxID=1883 RepID=UPI000C27C500|nr:hypothetical protein [Streptomyces sp. CB02120-2]PJN18495.1 hypothetical protein CG724_12895 [Streptomyces sp. CB02120-2]
MQLDLGRSNRAEAACGDTAGLRRAAGDGPGESAALTDLGVKLRALGRAEEAIETQHLVVAHFRKVGDEHNLGSALVAARRFAEAAPGRHPLPPGLPPGMKRQDETPSEDS